MTLKESLPNWTTSKEEGSVYLIKIFVQSTSFAGTSAYFQLSELDYGGSRGW